MNLDILIRGGTIIDGTGADAYQADLGISGTKISAMGHFSRARARRVLDASGLLVSPGFIDIHGHSDISLLVCPGADSKIMQGITTEVGGNCGESAGPLSPITVEDYRKDARRIGVDVDWTTLGEFLSRLEEGISINYATLVGLGTIRGAAMNSVDRPPSPSELTKMGRMVEQAMDEGALGISTGLVYPPGMYAETEEIAELARVASRRSGIYATHMRGEGDKLSIAVEEALEISRKAQIQLQISHLKAVGSRNWGKMPDILSKMDEAAEEGVQVTADRYPYTASSTSLSSIFPAWSHQGGRTGLLQRLKGHKDMVRLREAVSERIEPIGWQKIVVTNACSAENRDLEGRSLADGALERGMAPFDLAAKLVLDSEGLASMLSFSQDESDMLATLTHKRVMVASDSGVKSREGVLNEGKPHPRCYGTFPAFFDLFVKKKHLLSREEAIYKMTGMPAKTLGLAERGELKEGFFADIVVFDESKIKETATYENPHSYPEGVVCVMVNGRVVVENGVHSEAKPGVVLRKRGAYTK